ncbi:GDA1/CD39 nucleoside phosphatase family protein [Euphorbia peplus]|nr:GDA1/CD39 nucleoside phosphatase family protein [Euphorbia peplus]
MDSITLQSRTSNTYFPPHRTQLHPRMHSNPFSPPNPSPQNPNSKPQSPKFLIFTIFLLTIPFLFYLFFTAQKIHHSTKFAEPKSRFFAVVIDSGGYGTRVRVFELLQEGIVPFGDGQMPLVAGYLKIGGFLEDSGNAGRVVEEAVRFAKGHVPRKEWGNTKVQLMGIGGEVNGLEVEVKGRILESCRRVLRGSGFVFKDEWARIIQDEEKGVYAWMAVNYAFGTLGGDPADTTGVVELGGSSLQVTSASRALAKTQFSRMIKVAGVTYNLQAQKLPGLGQDTVWESLRELHNSRALPSSRVSSVGNPCIPKGYELSSSISGSKLLLSFSAGNFTACKLEALALLKSRQEECTNPPCKIIPSFLLELQGKPASQQSLFFTSEIFGLVHRSSLSELEAAGKQYCGADWDELKSKHHGTDDLDLLRYCFSSAYMVALLHDGLGIPMNDKRVGLENDTESSRIDWTLGAFLVQSMVDASETEVDSLDDIVGNESVTYFSLFAFLVIALLGVSFVLQWRKPQLKTIYDLEKGRYIVTRLPR